ncbi:MAG: ParA family partition ATPase [Phormidesmis sp.]
MIIALSSLKGGVGKSTLSLMLAESIAYSGSKVLLVDADSQGSVSDWAAAREVDGPFSVVGMAHANIHKQLPKIAADYDHVIVDTPPRIAEVTRSAILAADVVLIPVSPSAFDNWASDSTTAIIKEAQVFKDDLLAAFVVSKKIVGTAIAANIVTALQDYEITVFQSPVSQRVVFAECASGHTLSDLERKGAAVREIKALNKELLKFINLEKW